MSIFNDDDLLILCRPGDGKNGTHYKINYQQLKQAIIAEIDGGVARTTGEDTTTTTTTTY